MLDSAGQGSYVSLKSPEERYIVVANDSRKHSMQGLELKGQWAAGLWLNCLEGWEADEQDEQK